MKKNKMLALLLTGAMVFSFASCEIPSGNDSDDSGGGILEQAKGVLQTLEEVLAFADKAIESVEGMEEELNTVLSTIYNVANEVEKTSFNSMNSAYGIIPLSMDADMYAQYHELEALESKAVVSIVQREMSGLEEYLQVRFSKFQELEELLKESEDGTRIEIKDELDQVKIYYRKDGDRYYEGKAQYVDNVGGDFKNETESNGRDIVYYVETGYWMEEGSLYYGDMQKLIWTEKYIDHPSCDANTYEDWENYVAYPTIITKTENAVSIEKKSYENVSGVYLDGDFMTIVEADDAFYLQLIGASVDEAIWLTEDLCTINGVVDYELFERLSIAWEEFRAEREHTEFWARDIYLHAKVEKETGKGVLKMFRDWVMATGSVIYPTNWITIEDMNIENAFESIKDYDRGDAKMYYLCEIEF